MIAIFVTLETLIAVRLPQNHPGTRHHKTLRPRMKISCELNFNADKIDHRT